MPAGDKFIYELDIFNMEVIHSFQQRKFHNARSLLFRVCQLIQTAKISNDINDTTKVLFDSPSFQSMEDIPLLPARHILSENDVRYQEIYNTAFQLPYYEKISPTFAGSVILYNLGLLYHNEAIQLGRSTASKKALRLYKRSTSLLLSSKCERSNSAILLLAALCHNMAHIFKETFQLSHSLAMISAVANIDCGIISMSARDREFFSTNAYFVSRSHTCCASAA
jgi:hypothetical protein